MKTQITILYLGEQSFVGLAALQSQQQNIQRMLHVPIFLLHLAPFQPTSVRTRLTAAGRTVVQARLKKVI